MTGGSPPTRGNFIVLQSQENQKNGTPQIFGRLTIIKLMSYSPINLCSVRQLFRKHLYLKNRALLKILLKHSLFPNNNKSN